MRRHWLVLVSLTACKQADEECEVTQARTQEPSPELDAWVETNNSFGMDIFRAAAPDVAANAFLSPLSIHAALGMTYAGAADTTAEEMRQTMGITLDDAVYHQTFGAYLGDLDRSDPCLGFELHTADRLFGQDGAQWKDPFMAVLDDDYKAPLQVVDYASDAEAARKTINGWVSDQTAGHIAELFAPGSLDGYTKLVLANAIYFKGAWKTEFDKANTHPDDFYLSDGSAVQTDFMSQSDLSVRYGTDADGYQVLELPYKGDEVTMIAVMPPAGRLQEAEETLDTTVFAGWLDLLGAPTEQTVVFPKFTLEGSYDLVGILSSMGMPEAFTKAADFGPMTDDWDLHIGAVVHKSYVAVDEEGTVAAAATAVGMQAESASMPITIDRPFLFFIYDSVTGAVLFQGRLADPTKP